MADDQIEQELLLRAFNTSGHANITNANPHGTDHHMLDGLADDDHAQYLLLAGRTGQRVVTPLIFGTATDNTTIEADGTVKYNGAAAVWNDINLTIGSLRPGATGPGSWTITGTGIIIASFTGTAAAQSAHGSMEILHDYKEGSDITPHIHWCPTTTGAGNVVWQLEYSWINKDGAITTSTVISITTAATGVVGQEIRSNFPAIAGAGKTMGSRFVFRLFRDPAHASDTYGAEAGALDFGVHYERDTTGSREIGSK